MDLLFHKQKRWTFLCALLLLLGLHQVIQAVFGTKSVEDSLLWIEISITQLAVAVFFSEMILLVLIARWILGWGKLPNLEAVSTILTNPVIDSFRFSSFDQKEQCNPTNYWDT